VPTRPFVKVLCLHLQAQEQLFYLHQQLFFFKEVPNRHFLTMLCLHLQEQISCFVHISSHVCNIKDHQEFDFIALPPPSRPIAAVLFFALYAVAF